MDTTSSRKMFAARLRARREELGLNQAQLAELAGIYQANLSKMETGKMGVQLGTLDRLAACLGVSPSYLISEDS